MNAATSWRLGQRPALDGLRGVAVLLVVGQHAGVPSMERAGGAGVTLFFVLSGFLITTLLLEERQRTGRIKLVAFYVRRARRLLPALAVFLFAAFVVFGIAPHVIAAIAAYGANWLFAINDQTRPVVHTWTLSIEEQFYVLWPLLLIGIGRVPVRILAVGAFVAMVAVAGMRIDSALAGDDWHWTMFATHLRADAILAGCALAFAFAFGSTQLPRWWLAVAMGGLAVAAVLSDFRFHVTAGIPLAIVASVVAVSEGATRDYRVLTWRPLVYVGTISYALYLWHLPIIEAIGEDSWFTMLGAVALSVAVAAVSHRYIERPFLRRATLPSAWGGGPARASHR